MALTLMNLNDSIQDLTRMNRTENAMQHTPIKENDDDMFGGSAPVKPGGRRVQDKDLFGTSKRLVIAKVLRDHAQGCVKEIVQAQRRAQAGKARRHEDAEYLRFLQRLANLMTKVADVFQFKGTAAGWLAYHRALRKLNAEGVEEDIANELESAGINLDELPEYFDAIAQVYPVYAGMRESTNNYLREFVEWTDLIVTEADKKKQTKTKTDQPGLDPNMFTPKMDQPLTRQEPEQPKDQQPSQPRDIRRASAQRTRQATAGITPTDQMSNMLGRLRNIEIDPDLPDYPDTEPETLPSVDVNTRNLPAVASANLQAAGLQNPEFHQVAALPGNMAAMIRQLGRNLFGSLTATPTNRIHVVANLGGQGPNTTQEVNAVAGYLREHGTDLGSGDIDFNQVMPGYQADTHMYSAGGIRWMLVKDFAGQYIYCWPESDSVDYDPQKRLR